MRKKTPRPRTHPRPATTDKPDAERPEAEGEDERRQLPLFPVPEARHMPGVEKQ